MKTFINFLPVSWQNFQSAHNKNCMAWNTMKWDVDNISSPQRVVLIVWNVC